MAWSIFSDGGGDAYALGWAKQLLASIGAPASPGNIEFIYQWEKAEGGGGKYNPLNQGPDPGKPYLTSTGSQYGGGAADYTSWAAGLEGASDYLKMPNYRDVYQNLLKNDPVAARRALWASPWASSHYGYGSSWPNVKVPGGVNPVLPVADGSSGATPAAFDSTTCAWGITIPIVGKTCIASNTQLRALIAGTIIIGSSIVLLWGTASLVVFAFRKTGAMDAVTQVVGVIPGVGTAAKAGMAATKSSATKAPATKKAVAAPSATGGE